MKKTTRYRVSFWIDIADGIEGDEIAVEEAITEIIDEQLGGSRCTVFLHDAGNFDATQIDKGDL